MRLLFRISRPVILASASPRRKDFLAGLGLEFQVLPALASEPVCGPGEFPGDFTMRSAALKARDAFSRLDGKVKSLLPVVIGADTVVTLNEMVMGKPQDEAEALDMLAGLKARTLLDGYRGAAPRDLDALADCLVRIAAFAADHKDSVRELDLNPVFVYEQGQGVRIADALIVKDRD